MPINPVDRFGFARDSFGYPANPNEAFRTEAQYTIPLPRRGSGKVLELQCGCEPRIVQSAWFTKPGEAL